MISYTIIKMMIYLRITWMLLSVGFVEIFIWLPLYVLGSILMPFLLVFARTRMVPSRLYGNRIEVFSSKIWQTLFGNWEDGLCAEWWALKNGAPLGSKISIWNKLTWFHRNPVTNMRFWPIISTLPDPKKVKGVFLSWGWVAWQGGYTGCRCTVKDKVWWFGYKIMPWDGVGIDPKNYRNWGIGITCQRSGSLFE